MKIRTATEHDLSEVLAMNQASLPHVSNIKLEDLEYFFKCADPFLVIENDNELAGFMIILQKGLDYGSMNYAYFCNNYSDFDYVDRIVILEKYHGKKFGTALYQHLFEHSTEKLIACEVNLKPPNPNSMGFHKSLGFSQVAEQETEGGKKSVAMMIKKL